MFGSYGCLPVVVGHQRAGAGCCSVAALQRGPGVRGGALQGGRQGTAGGLQGAAGGRQGAAGGCLLCPGQWEQQQAEQARP